MTTCNATNHITDQQCTELLSAVGDALYVIGGKWKLRIIITLANGPKRFNELQKTLDGISARVLSNDLKELELNGFIKRKVIENGNPSVVEYELQGYSDVLSNVVFALSDFGSSHRKKIMQKP